MIAGERADVREAESQDLTALSRSLVRAFVDDPVAQWAAPRKSDRDRALAGFFDAYLAHKQPHGFVSCTSDSAGAAIWAPPGKSSMTMAEAWAIVRPNVFSRLALRGPLIARGAWRVDRLHPEAPHFYLAAIGVDPSAQGRGLGSRLLAPVLNLCDEDRVGAYLESSDPANIDFYVRHGFRVVEDLRLPRGPLIHTMWRDPR